MNPNAMVQMPSTSFFPAGTMKLLVQNKMKLDSPGMRVNSTLLRKDEWLAIDRNLVELRDKIFNGVADLISRGLVSDLGNIGVTIAEWERINDIEDAEVSMSPRSGAQEDTVSFDIDGVPVPLIHKDFRFDIRRLMAARNNGTQLDTTQQMMAGKKVFEKIEDILFNGHTISLKGYNIYGYRTHPERVTDSLTAAWDSSNPTNILLDVKNLLLAADTIRSTGPFVIYIPIGWAHALRDDYKADTERTVLTRILQHQEIVAVKATEALTSDLVMVEMSRQTVELAKASDIVNIPWQTLGGMEERFKVMGAMVPKIKVDGRGDIAVFHWS
jgi:uncharacterized linocin/CFP29 family protein